jgi:hypothetical protein
MATDSFFAMACGGLIASLFGALLCFFGYRLFLVLLPIWGFFFGLVLGAQSMQAIFGTGFLSTITSWVVGFVVAVLFAGLSYLFYFFAVALIAGSLGYIATVGILLAIGMNMNFLTWLIAIVVAIALAFVTLRFNLAKWVIIIATGFAGAAVAFGAFFVMFFPYAQLLENPIRAYLSESPLLMILAIVFAVAGIVFQFKTSQSYTVESYDRWAEEA